MAFTLRNWFDELAGKAAIPVKPPPGGPASAAPVDSLLSPTIIREQKWERRFRRLLVLGIQPGIQGVPPTAVGAFVLNQFNPEDNFPDEQLLAASHISNNGGGKSIVVVNPAGSGVLFIVEEVVAIRTVSAGVVWFGSSTAAAPALIATIQIQRRDTRGAVLSPILMGPSADIFFIGPPGISADASGLNVNPARLKAPFIMKPGSWFEAVADNQEATLVTIHGRMLALPATS